MTWLKKKSQNEGEESERWGKRDFKGDQNKTSKGIRVSFSNFLTILISLE